MASVNDIEQQNPVNMADTITVKNAVNYVRSLSSMMALDVRAANPDSDLALEAQ